jgi:hypothetical protein
VTHVYAEFVRRAIVVPRRADNVLVLVAVLKVPQRMIGTRLVIRRARPRPHRVGDDRYPSCDLGHQESRLEHVPAVVVPVRRPSVLDEVLGVAADDSSERLD